MENQEKFKSLIQNEDFVTKLLEMQTPEEVQEEFKKQGVDISLDEIKQLGSAINYMIKKGKTELTEEDLVEIGGGKFTWKQDKFEEAFASEAGKQLLLLAAAPVVVGVATGMSVMAKWGFDRLTQKLDQAIDKNNPSATVVN